MKRHLSARHPTQYQELKKENNALLIQNEGWNLPKTGGEVFYVLY
jgi:hypothetical protein